MIFHTGADLPMFIFASTSWMIPKSIETNFKRERKKKSARLKTQEGNLGKKRRNKRKKGKEKVTFVKVIELLS